MGFLETVTDSFGRSLAFTYDAQLRVATILSPAGATEGTYTFTYDAAGNLATVTYPDGRVRTYHYNEPALTSGASLPNALTGITDENNVRFASYGYDAQGKAIFSERAGVLSACPASEFVTGARQFLKFSRLFRCQ